MIKEIVEFKAQEVNSDWSLKTTIFMLGYDGKYVEAGTNGFMKFTTYEEAKQMEVELNKISLNGLKKVKVESFGRESFVYEVE